MNENKSFEIEDMITLTDGRRAKVIRKYNLRHGGYRYQVATEQGERLYLQGEEFWTPAFADGAFPQFGLKF
jgi:hypothetical protein